MLKSIIISLYSIVLGADNMIPAYRDEISTRPAETDFTLRLHVEIKFPQGAAVFHLVFD